MAAAPAANSHLSNKGGYPKEIVAVNGSSCDPKFLCTKCCYLLKDPIQSFCGHRYCRHCLEDMIRSGETKCEKCSTEENEYDDPNDSLLQKDRMFPDNAIKREMSGLKAKCVFPGCSWTGLYRDYESHYAVCGFKPVKCKFCNASIATEKLQAHLNNLCTERKVKCKHCNTEIKFSNKENHHQVCIKFPVKCDVCGKKKISRDKYSSHLEMECEFQKISCPAGGCSKMIEKNKLQDHLSSNIGSHFVSMSQKLSALEEKVNHIYALLTDRKANKTDGKSMNGSAAAEVHDISEKLELIDSIIGIVCDESKKYAKNIAKLEQELETLKTKNRNLEHILAQKETLKEFELKMKLEYMENASYDGTLLWKITDITKKRRDAISGKIMSIYSPPFFTNRNGYKFSLRLYPNGDGIGSKTHLSLFFVIMKGNVDGLLCWPFAQKVTLMMIDQEGSHHITDTFRPDPKSSSFQRPVTDMNIASGCPKFVELDKVFDRSQNNYVKDDTLYIRCFIDLNNLNSKIPESTFIGNSLKSN